MKTIKLTALLAICISLFACGSNQKEEQSTENEQYVSVQNMNVENLAKEIKKREAALSEDSTKVDRQKAMNLIDAYVAYANNFSNRNKADEYLFKAGELAMGLNLTTDAIKYLEKVYNDFPDYEKRPYSLFLKAFILENQAMAYDQAKEAYQEFIDNYPSHEMADDAEYSIQNMGKTPEELIREFEIQDSLRKAQEAA